jgi:hypothetical protein
LAKGLPETVYEEKKIHNRQKKEAKDSIIVI